MQSVSSRIWTRVAVSISYDDNHYTTGTSITEEYLIGFILRYVIGQMSWVFASGPGDWGSIPDRNIPKT